MMKAEKKAFGEPIFGFRFCTCISNPKFWVLSCVLVFLPVCSCRDKITLDSPIRDRLEDVLVSEGRRFELGFFTPDGSLDARRRYVGIWDYGSDPKSVVWVANREPVPDHTGLFQIAKDGNLAVSSKGNASLWSTSLESSANFSRTVRLMDSGNLMVIGEDSQTLWQSFKDGTTDTFLPGMSMSSGFKLISWKGPGDPAEGNFTLKQDENQYVIKSPVPYWKSGTYQDDTISNDMPEVIGDLLSDELASENNIPKDPISGPVAEYIPRPTDTNNSRVRINFDGELLYLTRDNQTAPFSVIWREPRDYCSRFNPCGNFGSCNKQSIVPCKCLPGFVPTVPNGCIRKSAYDKDKFLSLKMMRAGKPSDDGSKAHDDDDCMKQCISIDDCQAYSFIPAQQRGTGGGKCWMWFEELHDIQEDNNQGLNLNVRIARADIDSIVKLYIPAKQIFHVTAMVQISGQEPLKKSCGTCGTNIIPYPLSNGSNCGDPSYSLFNCNNSTGQLYFQTPNNKYRVIRVDQQTLNFTIQLNLSDCTNGTSDISSVLSQSSQFYKVKCHHTLNNLSSDASSTAELLTELEIRWNLPKTEPPCDSSDDCLDWPWTTCNTTGNGTKRCLCISNLRWNSTILNCTESQVADNSNQPSGGGTSSHSNKLLYLIFLVTIPIVIVSVGCFYNERRKSSDKQVKRKQVPENLAARLYDSERRVKEWISSGQFGEDDKKDIDVPFFDLEVIMEATGNFSDENKLGRGGFGPVYKGNFPGGQEIAVKRLLSGSGQGLEEFKNEVVLIAKLQHRNLVRLLGYCVEGDEKMLLYEYMPNKSLDSFLFDQARCALLTWEMRLEIILGIARGMLYLHQDSRLRIIHRDLKTSNVLLDEEMNPKISDFGLARIFEGKQTEASTQRVMGTYGYMSPEYALDGFFSIKSDVFSFGVVVLEIISGKRNTGIYLPEGQLNLLNHAWRLWSDNNAMDLTDPVLEGRCNRHEVLKCINVALLCVQEDPNDRPTMSNVLFMLGGEIATVPTPKKPAFALKPSLSSTGSSSTRPDSSFTISSAIQQGR